MKKLSGLLTITIVSLMFLSCISPQQQAEQAWRVGSSYTYYYFSPHMLKTSEEAMSTIKFLQPSLEQGDDAIIDLQVDQYGLMTKSNNTTQSTRYVVEPVTTSGFANSNLSSYYSTTTYVGRNVTTTDTSLITKSLVFKNIQFIELFNVEGARDWYWNVSFGNNGKNLYSIYAKDKQTALELIDAVFTLARKSGAVIETGKLGIFISPITPRQADTLGLMYQKGVVISLLVNDSPAEKSGLKINDIITHIDSTPVATIEDYDENIRKKQKNKVKLSLIRKTDFNVEKNVYNYEQFEKVISLN